MALLTVIIIMSAIFSPYGFYTNVYSIRKSIDERLITAANGVKEIIPDDYHDRLKEGKVSPAEMESLRKKLADFKNRIRVTYLYALVRGDDGKIYFTLDQEVKPMTEYAAPSDDVLEVFKTRKLVTAQCPDAEFGLISRTALIPFKSPKGDFYVIGADLNVNDINSLIDVAIRNFAILLGCGIVFVVFITMFLSRRISLPIKKLSEFTKRLADSNFSPSVSVEDDLPTSMVRTSEVSALVENIDGMRAKLKEYIVNLEAEVTARNLAESELKIAGEIQKSFLPQTAFENDFALAAASMKPAKQAGGDLYDFFPLKDGRACFAIGDVSGKGMPAALFMTRTVTLLRAATRTEDSLSKMAEVINDMLAQSNESCTFVTFFLCALSSDGVLEFVNCGHNPPYIKRADGAAVLLDANPNCILGVFEDKTFEPQTAKLNPDDALVCYTDGVTEAVAKDGSFYGDARLAELAVRLPMGTSAESIVSEIEESVAIFAAGAEQSDDITVLVLSRKA